MTDPYLRRLGERLDRSGDHNDASSWSGRTL